MKTNWKWIVGIAVMVVVLFALPTLLHSFFGYPGFGAGMMFASGWNRPLMGGFGRSAAMMSPFGGVFMGNGMLLGWLIPVGLLFLLVYGAVALFNRLSVGATGAASAPAVPLAAESHCGNCSEVVENGWKACPYCGEKL